MLALDLGLARHERQVVVDLTDDRDAPPGAPQRLDITGHFERDIGVGGEAHAIAALLRRDELGEGIDAMRARWLATWA